MAELPYGQGAKLEPYATVLPDVPREMHNYEEIFVLYTTDEVKFMTLINGGISSSFETKT